MFGTEKGDKLNKEAIVKKPESYEPNLAKRLAQSAGAIDYTDCISAEG